ncbi:MAG: Flp pilus assembly complex ATPase component TadA, partial [Kiritimatiellae bacterium]|nr:Flp pilus assembly complex ATPase component TadA [Kiritimatiellia bacterium]
MSDSEPIVKDPLLELVEDQGILSEEQIQKLQDEHESSGRPVRNLLVSMGFIDEDRILEVISGYLGVEVINLPATDIPPDVVHSVPASVARMYNVMPVSMGVNSITLAVFDLISPQIMDELMFVLTCDVLIVLAHEEDVTTFIHQFYGDDSDAVKDMLSDLESKIEEAGKTLDFNDEDDDKGIEEVAGSTPVIKFVNLVLYQAVNDRASDIHFEPFEKDFRIRYRVDGALYEMAPPPRRLALPLISRIKIMSDLNIAERRLPQDGRISLRVRGEEIDVRVSTMPTVYGESVSLRLLMRSSGMLGMNSLGLSRKDEKILTHEIHKPHGILLVTGPTGSG